MGYWSYILLSAPLWPRGRTSWQRGLQAAARRGCGPQRLHVAAEHNLGSLSLVPAEQPGLRCLQFCVGEDATFVEADEARYPLSRQTIRS